MRETLLTGCINSGYYISHVDYKEARWRVGITLSLNLIQAEIWLDHATGSLLQYYVPNKGHPITEDGHRTIQRILGPHSHSIIMALDVLIKDNANANN